MTHEIKSPSGLDLKPPVPSVAKVSWRVALAAVLFVGVAAVLIIFGVYKRGRDQRTVITGSSGPTTATGGTTPPPEVLGKIPPGTVPVVGTKGPSVEAEQKPSAASDPPSQEERPSRVNAPVRVHSRSQSLPAASYEPITPVDSSRARSSEREQQAMDAPTSARGGDLSGGVASALGSPPSSLPAPPPGEGAGLTTLAQSFSGSRSQAGLGDAGNLASDISLGDSADGGYRAQNMQDRKEAFLRRARLQTGSNNYVNSTRTPGLSRYEIKAGWDIPAILDQGINSDNPGKLRARVRENVYDTATGKYLLMPQGAILVGEYDSHIAYGQNAVQVAWNRIIFPDGSSVNLDGMIGQDAKGYAGLRHKVDNHYGRLIGFAVLTSLFSAAFELSQPRRGSILTVPSSGEIIAGSAGREVAQLGAQVTRRNLNIQPTIKVPIGYRFNVRVERDLLFDSPYSPYTGSPATGRSLALSGSR